MVDKKMKTFHIKEISKPFKFYSVDGYEQIFVEGFKFPIEMSAGRLQVKDNRCLKPPATIEELIARLEFHNITFTDDERAEAKVILKYINYYRLSVFILFLKEDKSFSCLMSLHDFDNFLRESINRLVPPVEVALKTSLAHFISLNYSDFIEKKTQNDDGLVYLDYQIYKAKEVNKGSVDEMLSRFSQTISGKQDKDPSVQHHVEYYSGQVPIWVLFEHLTMGGISTFVTYLDRPIRKAWVRDLELDIKDATIVEWVKTIQQLRNTAAHCTRLYGRKFNYNPNIHKVDKSKLSDKYDDQVEYDKLIHTVFTGLLILRQFYLKLPYYDQGKWKVFLCKLDKRLEENRNIDIYRIGCPENWKELLGI